MILEGCGTHAYRKPIGASSKGKTLFCEWGCKCYKDSNGFGGPDGVDPKGKCPNAPAEKATETVPVDADRDYHY